MNIFGQAKFLLQLFFAIMAMFAIAIFTYISETLSDCWYAIARCTSRCRRRLIKKRK